jgi:hypothetical protein
MSKHEITAAACPRPSVPLEGAPTPAADPPVNLIPKDRGIKEVDPAGAISALAKNEYQRQAEIS